MSNNPFKTPEAPSGITFMLRGGPGVGKTTFALRAKRVTAKPVAYIGTDRGAKFYADHPEYGGFLAVENRSAVAIRAAVSYLRDDNGASFGALVFDTITDAWSAEQSEFEKPDKNGIKGIPMRSWRPLREGHESLLREAQALPMHVFLICEEKPIYEKIGDELREIGTREDADKRDAYSCDVRLRLYVERGEFYAEVLKDRTHRPDLKVGFPMGTIIHNPRVEMWVKGAVTPGVRPKPAPGVADTATATGVGTSARAPEGEAADGPDAKADALIARIGECANKFELTNWSKKHAAEIKALPDDARARVVAAGTSKKAFFANGAASTGAVSS